MKGGCAVFKRGHKNLPTNRRGSRGCKKRAYHFELVDAIAVNEDESGTERVKEGVAMCDGTARNQ